MKVTYIEKGIPHDFKRIDTIRIVCGVSSFVSGNLLYVKRNEFEYSCIAIEDIISVEK